MVIWLGVFIFLWIITFLPAWKLLLWLSAYSAGKKSMLSAKFILGFLIYRIIIIAPYLWLVLTGQEYLTGVLNSFIVGFVITGFILAIIRFVFRDTFVSFVWQIYGYVYDGLLRFYPYYYLINRVANLASGRKGLVLDLGGGTGNVTQLLNSNQEVVLVDGSSVMLDRARKKLAHRNNTDFVLEDIESFVGSYKGEKFSTVIMNNSLYVVTNRGTFWKNLHDIVAEDALIIISNSDRTGSNTIIKEHIKNRGFLSLLHIKLLAIFIIDQLISSLSSTGTFNFIAYETITKETKQYFSSTFIERCYGGTDEGVNILFTLKKR